MAFMRLNKELKQINNPKESNYFYSVTPNPDNFLEWEFVLIGPPETLYEGGIFKGKINFPVEYPNKPPKLKFLTEMYHPNIYKTGEVCISILHEGTDQYGYEDVGLRWNPSHSVNSVLMSILAMLGCPNFDSPANLDASVECKDKIESYKLKIYKLVSLTQR